MPEPPVGARCRPPRVYRPANVGPGPNRSFRGGRGASSTRHEVVVPEKRKEYHVDLVSGPLLDPPNLVADRPVVSAATPAALPPAALPEAASVVPTTAQSVPPVVVLTPSVALPVPLAVESGLA